MRKDEGLQARHTVRDKQEMQFAEQSMQLLLLRNCPERHEEVQTVVLAPVLLK